MNDKELALYLAELGNITRLRIFKLLIKEGDEGLSVGSIQKALDIPASTLSHHITKLVSKNLIKQERNGRILRCIANYILLNSAIDELISQCCIGPNKKCNQK